jgi:hypothetical protein
MQAGATLANKDMLSEPKVYDLGAVPHRLEPA